jgi:hypothetical protein
VHDGSAADRATGFKAGESGWLQLAHLRKGVAERM